MITLFGASITSDISQYFTKGNIGSTWMNIQLATLIPALVNLALIFAVVIFFFMFITGGIKWITAGGSKESIDSAQKTLSAAVIGLVIIFSAWAIKSLVYNFFGLGGGTAVQTCTYPENCDGSALKVHQCTGTIQGGICKYNPAINPNCTQCVSK